MNRRITVIGSANVDMIMKVERLPAVGETVTEGEFLQVFGGKGANQAVAAARAGGQVAFITCLGDDPFAPLLLDSFRQDGLETEQVRAGQGVPTGTALILFDRRGENMIAVAPGANDALTAADIEAREAVIRQSAMLVMQMEIPVATTRRALEIAGAAGIPVLFNYAPVRGCALAVSPHMTGLIVNEVEAAALSGREVHTPQQALDAAEDLRAQGPQFVILTLGPQGACVAGEGVRAHVPTYPVQAADTTAAGDAFCGALAVALVEGRALEEAARFANAAAALSVTRIGAQPSLPRRAEIEAFLASAAV